MKVKSLKQMQRTLRNARFSERNGWTVSSPAPNRMRAMNTAEADRPIVIELIGDHDAKRAERETLLCTALGRLLLTMSDESPPTSLGIAVPETDAWLATLELIPLRVFATMPLTMMLVSDDKVIEYPSEYDFNDRALLDDENLSDLVLPPGAEQELDAFLDTLE